MTYDELQKKYIQVYNENMRLRAENQNLRKQLGILNSPKEFNVTNSAINKHSSVDEKIDLYMSLFIGRNDVYARDGIVYKVVNQGISLFVGMSGVNFVTNKIINAIIVLAANFYHLITKQYLII